MENRLVAGIVAAAIAVIVLAGVLMPALNEATTINDTFTNEGYYYMNVADPNDEIIISFDHTKPRIVTVDGMDVTMPKNNVTFIASDLAMVRYFYISDTSASIHLYTTYPNGLYVDSYNNQDMTVQVTNGVITGTKYAPDVDPVIRTVTPTSDIYTITSDKAPYVMKKYDAPVKMNSESEFIVCGFTTIATSNSVALYAEGSIDDGITDMIFFREIATTTYDNVVIDYSPIDDHLDLYNLDKFTFDIEQGVITYNATYSAFIVPAEVTAERAVHLDQAMNTILSVIPILIIVAVLLGVVAAFILRRE